MPFLATFFTSVFSGLFAFLGTWVSKKLAFGAAVAATLLAVTIAFYVAIKALITGLAMSITNPVAVMAFYAVLPSNFATCITAMLAADVAAFLYRHQLATIKAVSGAN